MASLIIGALSLTSCYYGPTGVYTSQSVSPVAGHTSSPVGLFRTSSSYWFYDPFRRAYYDSRRRAYYNYLTRSYYRVPPRRHSSRHIPSFYTGRGLCPTPTVAFQHRVKHPYRHQQVTRVHRPSQTVLRPRSNTPKPPEKKPVRVVQTTEVVKPPKPNRSENTDRYESPRERSYENRRNGRYMPSRESSSQTTSRSHRPTKMPSSKSNSDYRYNNRTAGLKR